MWEEPYLIGLVGLITMQNSLLRKLIRDDNNRKRFRLKNIVSFFNLSLEKKTPRGFYSAKVDEKWGEQLDHRTVLTVLIWINLTFLREFVVNLKLN